MANGSEVDAGAAALPGQPVAGEGKSIAQQNVAAATPPAAAIFEATVTDKGQVTIPIEVRERMRLRGGHRLQFAVENPNRAVITPIGTKLSDLVGILGKPMRSATLEEMDEGIRRAVADRYLRAVGKKR